MSFSSSIRRLWQRRAFRVLCWAAVPLLLWWGIHSGVVAWFGYSDTLPAGVADAAIVPGNAVTPDGRPSLRLQARLDAAIDLYRKGRVRYILVSGATGKEGPNEGLVMAAWCRKQGVPDTAIVTDTAGYTTWRTAVFAAQAARQRGWRSVVGTSHWYHQLRYRLALELAGAPVTGMVHCPNYGEWFGPYTLGREWAGYYRYLLGHHTADTGNMPDQ